MNISVRKGWASSENPGHGWGGAKNCTVLFDTEKYPEKVEIKKLVKSDVVVHGVGEGTFEPKGDGLSLL